MQKEIKWMIIATLTLMAISCEEYKMVTYDEGGQINFMGWDEWNYERDGVEYLTWNKNFGINPLGDSLRIDTVRVGVKIMGEPTDYPRQVVFKVKALTTEEMQVEFLPEGYVVPAGEGKAAFKFVIKRPAKQNVVYKADLEFDYQTSAFTPGTVERQTFKLQCSDIVNQETWNVNPATWEGLSSFCLGDWSETKARFIITTLKITDFAVWASDDWGVFLDCLDLYYILDEYKAASAIDPQKYSPLWDETKLPDKVWISFPF